MSYADYEFYSTSYFGKAISEEDFPRLSLRASSFLDYYTQGRAQARPELEALKMACCAIAEQYQMIDVAQKLANKGLLAGMDSSGAELQSQTVGSWSKSYRSGGESAASALATAETAKAQIAAVAQQYLAGTGLLYRGRCCKCSHIL